VARVGQQRVAVPFTIPGERVRIEIHRRPVKGRPASEDIAVAVLASVLRPSPHRVEAPCPHFGPPKRGEGGCGGCTWQHIAYPEQLRLKTALVDRLVRAAVPSAPAVRPMIPSTPVDAPWGYRQKVHFVFDGDPLIMGHYARGSRRVIPVRECPVHDPRGNAVAFDFLAAFRRARVEAERGGLRAIAVRVAAATNEMLATLVMSKNADRRVREATRTALSRQSLSTSLHVNLHEGDDRFIFGRETRKISGVERVRDEVGGVSFLISPTSFFQTNVRAAEILVRLVSADIPPRSRVLDLYAGAGLFALPLARAGHVVTAVEENRAAVGDGEASARLNRISGDQCRFVAGRAEEFIRRAMKTRAASYDVVVLDPPREGCATSVLEQVFGELRPARGIYVSCNPDALARDLRSIVSHGYAVQSLQPVDMFPHTAHVETVAVVDRGKGTAGR
jgi:23S rRNA (uracil1939-C5)-methyltransferase